jgi:hypothetical protein
MSDLLISFLAISLFDCISIELWLKPMWRAAGWDSVAKYFRRYQLFTFGLWYLLFWQLTKSETGGFNWELIACQAALHMAGLEDLLYALWVPLFAKAIVAWEGLTTIRLVVWQLPLYWPWLGRHTDFISNYWLWLFAGDEVSLGGLVASIFTMSTILLGLWVVFF